MSRCDARALSTSLRGARKACTLAVMLPTAPANSRRSAMLARHTLAPRIGSFHG